MKKNNLTEIPILRTNKYYSTQELSQLFKANESTIKRWADTGKLKCFKTPGGHRKYTPEHISEFISNYNYEIISPETGLLLQGDNELVDGIIQKGDYGILSEIVFAEAVQSKKENIFAALKSCHNASVPLVTIYDEVILPTITKTLAQREKGMFSPAEEHLTKNVIIETLFQFKLLSRRVMFTDRVVISFAVTAGMQEVGLACAEHLLEVSGWRVFSLGVNMNKEILSDTINRYDPNLICLTGDFSSPDLNVKDFISMLKRNADEHGIQLLIAEFTGGMETTTEKWTKELSIKKFSTLGEMLTILYGHAEN